MHTRREKNQPSNRATLGLDEQQRDEGAFEWLVNDWVTKARSASQVNQGESVMAGSTPGPNRDGLRAAMQSLMDLTDELIRACDEHGKAIEEFKKVLDGKGDP